MIPDEAIEAANRAALGRYLNKETVQLILEAAAPHLMAELAESRDGELFRFTWAQREWLRAAGARE